MKKLISLLMALVLLCGALAVMCSCDDEQTSLKTNYYEGGLHFYLPEGFKKITVNYSQYAYYDGKAYFYFDCFTPEYMEEELEVDPNISVEAYTRQFCLWNDFSFANYTYDKETDSSVIREVYHYPSTEQMPSELFIFKIFRANGLLYIVTFNCPEADIETYEPRFNEWMKAMHT